MKNMKKLVMTAAMMLLVVTVTPKQVAAASKFSIQRVSPYGTSVNINLAKTKNYTEVELSKADGKVVDTKKYPSVATSAVFLDLKKNTAYCVRYRAVDAYGNALSGWSQKIGFTSCPTFEAKQVGKSLQAYYKMPKIKGVKKFKVSISKKQKSGYKKVGTAKPGKKITLKKCNGKAFTYTSYYVRIQPVFSKKVKSTYVHESGFRFSKGFF